MYEIICLTISQFIFSFSRTLNVRYTAKENVTMGIITSTLIKLTWLFSSAIGIESVINGDFIMCIVYIVSGLIGDYLSYKIKIK
jgi:hypothetical protein